MRVEVSRAVRPRRAAGGCATAALTALAVFVVVSVIAAVLFMASPTNNNAASTFIQPQSNSLRWDQKSPLTILLMRSDKPLAHSPPAASLVLASLNPRSHSAALLSIPSNLWVTIPGYGTGTLGDSYIDGGASLTLLVTQSVLHVPIPYYAIMGSDTLRQLVNMVGGVSLPTSHRVQHLAGAPALRYLRTADAAAGSQSDFTGNRSFLIALERRALQAQTFLQIPSIVNSLGGTVPTNVPYDQISAIAHDLLDLPPSRVHWGALDSSSGAVSPYANSGTRVVLPNWQRICTIAQNLFPVTWPTRGIRTAVLNGSGQLDAASRLAGWLHQARIPISTVGTMANHAYRRTHVIIAPGASGPAYQIARAAATLLRVPLVTGNVHTGAAPVTVLIGSDFQDPTQQ